MGLPRSAAKEWKFQHARLARLKEITRPHKNHARGDRPAGRYFANPGIGHPENGVEQQKRYAETMMVIPAAGVALVDM